MDEPVRWPRGRCEFGWERGGLWAVCNKRGRWLVSGQVRCGEHRDR